MPALVGLMTGHVGAGLSAEAEGLAPALVYGLAAAVELTLLVATVAAVVWVWTTYGPGRRMGMATRTEAGVALGVGRLRRVRKLIRPDLYGRAGRRASRLAPPHPPSRGVAGQAGRPVDAVDAAGHPWIRVRSEHAPATTPQAPRRQRFTPQSVGWRLGVGRVPRCGELWVPFDRTCGVYGPQGSGKTLDLLTPALLSAPGAALVTLTKVEDLLLTVDARSAGDRPVAVLDPFGMAPGLPELVWDPVDGCVDSMVAERRAKAFTAGTVKGAVGARLGGLRGPVLRRRGRQGAAGVLPRRRVDRPHHRARPGVGGQPPRRHHPRGDPAQPPARSAVLARAAARGAARGRPHRREHRHHGAAGDGAVLPGSRCGPGAPPARAGRRPTWPP